MDVVQMTLRGGACMPACLVTCVWCTGFAGAPCELAPEPVVCGVVEEFKWPSHKPCASARRM